MMAVGLGALLAVEIAYVAFKGMTFVAGGADGSQALEAVNQDPGNVKALARVLFSDYLLPFEVTSVLLVAAIVGVLALARRIGSFGEAVAESDARESSAV